MTNKTTLKRLKLDPYFSKTIETNLNVWSHDQNSYEIKFEFYDHQCNKPIDLTGADMRILLDHAGSQPKIYPLEIESKVLGLAKFIMPEQIRGCEGKFTAHIYADYPNRTHDFGSFTFYTKLSRLDGDLGGCMDEIYVSEFEKALEDIKEFKVDIDKNINDMKEHFDSRYDKAKMDVEEIESLINSNSVVKEKDYKLDKKYVLEYFKNNGFMITNYEELVASTMLEEERSCIISGIIVIEEDLTTPENLTYTFKNGGGIKIPENTTLTLNSKIEQGFQQIFYFKDETSKLTTDKIEYGKVMDYGKANYSIKVDWFGCKPNAYPSENYLYNDSTANGHDSTFNFKKCMEYAESCSPVFGLNPNRIQPKVIVEFGYNSTYYVKGDNPLGIQSKEKNVGYGIVIRGNHSTILWEPTSKEDSLFKKYGRVVNPNMSDFNVVLLGKKGQRWGHFISSKTGEGDDYHFWTRGQFSNLMLCQSYLNVGYDSVFNIDIDGSHSHDDLTTLNNVYAPCYNTFLDLKNREAVNWTINKTFFESKTDNAVHINIADGFSGALTFNSCEVLLQSQDETFIKTGTNLAQTPIRFIDGRLETRNDNKHIFLNVASGVFEVNNLNFLGGNASAVPHKDTRFAVIGENAFLRLNDAYVFNGFDVIVSDKTSNRANALQINNSSFFTTKRGNKRTTAYPDINFLDNAGSRLEIGEAIKKGYTLRKIEINSPSYTTGNSLSTTIGGNSATYYKEALSKNNNGKNTPILTGINSFPPYSVITDIRLNIAKVSTTDVDEILIGFYVDDDNAPSSNATVISIELENAQDYLNKDVLDGYYVSIPKQAYISISAKNKGATVSDVNKHPIGWLDFTYRPIFSNTDFLENSEKIGLKRPLASF